VIRSLTIGLPLDDQSTSEIDARVRGLLGAANKLLSQHALVPRTLRFTLPPSGAEGEAEGALLSRLRWVDELARATGVRWFCLPLDFVAAGPRRSRITAALDGIVRFERLFLNLILAAERQIAVSAAHDAAKLILDVSRKSNNGFDNFRVGASFNRPANAPFFPFSRHQGTNVAFSFALETTQVALEALRQFPRPHDAGAVRDHIAAALAPRLQAVDQLGKQLAEDTGTEYRGLDASFAPMPGDNVSVATLVEQIIGAPVGSYGSVFATAFLTDALRAAIATSNARSVGFNGVMYSILEDPALAASNNKRRINIDALLSLSTVCACGLDMVPIPGLSFPEEISAVMLDVAGLSCALDKPLGARLLPIPNSQVNELTKLNLDFLCDSRVLGLTSNDRRLESEGHLLGLRYPRR
jgi:uncharacterized protein (UPF0210 family)